MGDRMRRAARVDRNHGEIIAAFTRLGFSVADTSMMGQGFPDCVIAKHKRTAMCEIKDGAKSPSKRRLTEDQIEFRDWWKGTYLVVNSVDEALAISKSWGAS